VRNPLRVKNSELSCNMKPRNSKARAGELIERLDLKPHPEGGFYSEIHRSDFQVQHDGKSRAALTTIYFLLMNHQFSRWHVVDADEVWHYYEGSPLELYVMPPDFSKVEIITLGQYHPEGIKPVHVVPAGWWQAARASDEYTLCGCTVAPGFEFSGFRMMNETEQAEVKEVYPDLEFLVYGTKYESNEYTKGRIFEYDSPFRISYIRKIRNSYPVSLRLFFPNR
jgi:uncharacterized protein